MERGFKPSKPKDWRLEELKKEELPENAITYGEIDIFEDRIGRRLRLPVIAVNGKNEGPVLGLTAAVHGNEINGIPAIHRLYQNIDPENVSGVLILIPIVNLPGYLAYQREFTDSTDLNRVMPGNEQGPPSEVYAHHFTKRIMKYFDYHMDLHTASFGRINSHYIRANLKKESTKKMAMLQHADIILHAEGPANTVRDTANKMGIPSITVELGNPQVFQPEIVAQAVKSVENIMIEYGMIEGDITEPESKPVVCSSSYWTRCHDGGILRVHPELTEMIYEGNEMAKLYDIYGREDLIYSVPEDGIVIGKNVNPVVSTGDRILHLGIIKEDNE